jgi:hypothetical protein
MNKSDCKHVWEMANIQFGFVVFEKCFHCNGLRTYFTLEHITYLGDKYREGDHFWSRVENAQTFRFDLRCARCGRVEKFDDLMGLLYCTGCLPDCPVEIQRQKLEAERTWVVLASGFLTEGQVRPRVIPSEKLETLADYFNQRRDTSRSRIAILPFDLAGGFVECKAEFLHDVGMLSQEPPRERKQLF